MIPEFVIFIGFIVCWILFSILGGILVFLDLIRGKGTTGIGLEATKFEVGIDD